MSSEPVFESPSHTRLTKTERIEQAVRRQLESARTTDDLKGIGHLIAHLDPGPLADALSVELTEKMCKLVL